MYNRRRSLLFHGLTYCLWFDIVRLWQCETTECKFKENESRYAMRSVTNSIREMLIALLLDILHSRTGYQGPEQIREKNLPQRYKIENLFSTEVQQKRVR